MISDRGCWVLAFLLGAVFVSSVSAIEKRGDDKFILRARQLTFEGRRSGECYFAPDGKRLLFMSEREPGNPFFQIYSLDFESGDVHRISTGRGKTTCPYYQYGTGLIEYASTHLDPDFDADCEVEYARRREGRKRRGSWERVAI